MFVLWKLMRSGDAPLWTVPLIFLLWVNLHGSWIRQSANSAQTCLMMVEDITERRKIEEALREKELRLERGQRIEAIGMFAGGIAHDFNNLLAVIFGCCER